MNKDRTAICKIISDMLDNADSVGVYATSTAFARLEHYVEQERIQAIGWMHAEACVSMDKGDDPRLLNVPDMLARARQALGEINNCGKITMSKL